MEISIRRAVPGDLTAIQRLNQALFDYETKFNEEYNLSWTYSEIGHNYFKHRLENENAIIFVAESKKEIIGYIIAFISTYPFRKEIQMAELENMFIDEKFRKQKIGTKLLEAVRNELVRRKIRRLKVESITQNTDAIQFYKNFGFQAFNTILEMDIEEKA